MSIPHALQRCPLLRSLVLYVERAGGAVEKSWAQVKHVDKEVLDRGEGDGRGHWTATDGLTVAEKQALWEWSGACVCVCVLERVKCKCSSGKWCHCLNLAS